MEMVKIERQIFIDLTYALVYMNGFITELAIAYIEIYVEYALFRLCDILCVCRYLY